MDEAAVIRGAVGRRAFMGGAARLGLGAVSVIGRGGPLGLAADRPAAAAAGVREIRLETRQVTWELAPGRTVAAMAYTGRVPGPEIRVKEGERVRVVLSNALAEPTTVHWHGVDVPNAMDGVPGITQKPVPAGEIGRAHV